jgi:hypothetical protein
VAVAVGQGAWCLAPAARFAVAASPAVSRVDGAASVPDADQRARRVDACVARTLALIAQEADLSLTEIAARLKRPG